MIVNAKLERKTTFPLGTEVYYIKRIRYSDDQPRIIDHNYFRKDLVVGLTKEIALSSVYAYIETKLNQKITSNRWTITTKEATEDDLEILDLEGLNCISLATKYVFNDQGLMFEFSESRHHPKHFVFSGQASK
jgi:GntR family trehalose operon transcriptional repressor